MCSKYEQEQLQLLVCDRQRWFWKGKYAFKSFMHVAVLGVESRVQENNADLRYEGNVKSKDYLKAISHFSHVRKEIA